MPQYRATKTALLVPRLDDKGKATTRNTLVRPGKVESLPEADAKGFVEAGVLELVQTEQQETEKREGDEVNGPGASTLTGFPTPVPGGSTAAGGSGTPETGPKRPGKSASLEDLRSYATVVGVEFEDKDTKADLNRKFDEREAASKSGGEG